MIDEMKLEQQDKAAANMLVKTSSGDVQKELQALYDEGKYREVMERAAVIDVPNREQLAAKVSVVANENYAGQLSKEQAAEEMNHIVEALNNATTEEEIKKIYEQSRSAEDLIKDQCAFFYKVEGLDEEFLTASQAISAWKKSNNIETNDNKHKFSFNPKFEDE